MSSEKKRHLKTKLHPRNKNREQYNLSALILATPELKNYIKPNKLGADSIDFSNPLAVKLLNKALLSHYYDIKNWEFPNENLCPPIPGRADYLHYMADLLSEYNSGIIPTGNTINCLDVGVGASCIYPIIGVTEYHWKFIGSDINSKSITAAQHIVNANASLKGMIECRLQVASKNIFQGILKEEDTIDITICNPPFHATKEDAQKGTRRKIKNLSGEKAITPQLNFAGVSNELIYEGGEYSFIVRMIRESEQFAKNCFWFSTLVSKQSNLKGIYKALKKTAVTQVKTIPMGTGNKLSRIVVWTFLSNEEQLAWSRTRWNAGV